MQVLGKLHAFSSLLGVMAAQSSERILLGETHTLTDIGFIKMVYKKMDQTCCELGQEDQAVVHVGAAVVMQYIGTKGQ